jgi:hypothetical protein
MKIPNPHEGKWTLNEGGRETWRHEGEFATKAEAVAEAAEVAKEQGWEAVDVGQCGAIGGIDIAAHALDYIQEQVYEQCGEAAEDFSPRTDRKSVDELDDALWAVVLAWMEKHGVTPTCYPIEHIESLTL